MSGNALNVEVGADVTSLRTNLAVAKAELKDTSSEVRDFAAQMVSASDAAKAELLPQLEALTTKEAQLRAEIAATNAELKEATPAAEHAGGAFVTLRETTEGLNAKITETKGLFTGLGELFLVGFGGEKIYELAKAAVELGDSLQKAKEETGIQVETLSALKASADYADVSFDQLQRSLTKFTTNLQSAQSGTGKTAEILHSLGISQVEITQHGDDAAFMFERVAKALDEYADGANKQALVSELFGAKMRDLGVVMKDVAENGIAGLTARAREQGVLFDGEFADGAKNAHEQIVELDHVVEALKADAILLAPAIEAVAHALELVIGGDAERAQVQLQAATRGVTEMTAEVANMRARIQTDGPVLRVFEEADLKVAEYRLQTFQADVEKFKARVDNDSWSFSFGSLAQPPQEQKPPAPVPPDDAAERKAAAEAKQIKEEEYQQAIATYQADAAQYAIYSDDRMGYLQKELATAREYWGEGSKQFEAIQREINAAQVSRIQQGQQEMVQDTAAFIQSKQTELSAAIAHENSLVQQKQITASEAEKYEIDLTNAIYAQELKRLDLEILMLGEGTDAYRKAMADREKIVEQQQAQIQKITDKTADEEAHKQQQVYQEIARSSAQTGAQLITGRETVAQAVDDLAEKGLEKILEYGIKEVIEHSGFETMKVAATAAGEQAQVAAKVAGTAEGKAVEAAAGSVSVIGDANKAAAGAFSAVAGIPIIGPILAPVAAATAFVAVEAFDVFSAEGGFDIPAGVNPVVQMHEKEMVLPARQANVIRQMAARESLTGSVGGINIHLAPGAIVANGRMSAKDLTDLEAAVTNVIGNAVRKAHRNGAFT